VVSVGSVIPAAWDITTSQVRSPDWMRIVALRDRPPLVSYSKRKSPFSRPDFRSIRAHASPDSESTESDQFPVE